MSMISINLNTLKAVSKAMPRKDPRKVLLSVLVEVEKDGKTTLTATDGKVLCSMSEVNRENKGLEISIMLPDSTVADIVKRAPKSLNPDAFIDTEAKQVKIMDGKPALLFEPVDGKFPNYHAVIPNHNKQSVKLTSVTLRTDVLEKAAAIAKAAGGDQGHLTFFFETKHGQIQCNPVVTATHKGQCGLVMPVKVCERELRRLELEIWPKRITPAEQAERDAEAAAAAEEKRLWDERMAAEAEKNKARNESQVSGFHHCGGIADKVEIVAVTAP